MRKGLCKGACALEPWLRDDRGPIQLDRTISPVDLALLALASWIGFDEVSGLSLWEISGAVELGAGRLHKDLN